jgi:hypothetical protein
MTELAVEQIHPALALICLPGERLILGSYF